MRIARRLICQLTDHDWWAVSYPPVRRWECLRCEKRVEDAYTEVLEVRR